MRADYVALAAATTRVFIVPVIIVEGELRVDDDGVHEERLLTAPN